MKANPKKVHNGTAGIGSPQHMAGLLLNREAGTDLIHVPYKGGGPTVNDAIGGHVQAVIATISSTLGQHKGGLLGIIGIGEKEGFAGQPDIQAIAETVPGFEATSWLAFYAPAGTPKAAIDVLNRTNKEGRVLRRAPPAVSQGKSCSVETTCRVRQHGVDLSGL